MSVPIIGSVDKSAAAGYFFAYAALSAIALSPVWLTLNPPLIDYPNHMARMHILLNLSQSETLRQFYQVRSMALPNVAMDILVPALASLMSLNAAGKTFISMTLLLLSSGTMALHYAIHRRLSAWPLLVFLLLYNGVFLWGFLNYLFGLGLALWVLAAWIILRERSGWLRAPVFFLLGVVLFFAHLYALGIYALCVLGYEYAHYREQRKRGKPRNDMAWVTTYGQFVLPACLFLSISPTAEGYSGFTYGNFAFMVTSKLLAIADLTHSYSLLMDGATLLILTELVVLGYVSRKLVVNEAMHWTLGAVAVAFLAMPFQVFTSNFADYRLAVAGVLLLVASTSPQLPNVKWGVIAAASVFAIFIVRMAVITNQWHAFDHLYDEYMHAIDELPEGSRLFVAVAQPDSFSFQNPVDHLASSAVIRKSAFVPSLFALPAQQPIVFTRAFQYLAERTPGPIFRNGDSPRWHELSDRYDYSLVVREQLFKNRLPLDLELVYAGTEFRLYKMPHGSGTTNF